MPIVYENPLPSMVTFHESKARVKVLWGPVGTGKTTGALWEYILQCLESDIPLDGMAIRSSYRELRDSTIKTFNKWFGDVSEWREGDSMALIRLPKASDPRVTLEHILRFRSLQKADDVKKVQSFEGAFVMLDEVVPTFGGSLRASEGIPIEVVEITNSRLRHEFKGVHAHRYTQVIVANPPTPSHWLYKHFLSKDPVELAKRRHGVSVHFIPRKENVQNLPPDYYEVLCDAFHDPDLVRRLVEGEIVHVWSGEAVFPEAKDKVHITSERIEPVKGVPLILGWDYGLTPGTLITQIAPSGQWRWLSEVQNFNASFDTHLEMVRNHLHDHYPGWELRHWGDPAGATRSQTDEKTCVEMALAAGYQIKAGRQDWQSRKESMKQRLLRSASNGTSGLYVSRSGCPLAAEGLTGAYRYPKSASGEIGTRPLKNHVSHLMDCAQYIATREFEINPAAFMQRPGEFVPQAPPPPPDPFRALAKKTGATSTWLSRY